MTRFAFAARGFAIAAALPVMALPTLARAEVGSADKVACVPDKMTRCTAPGQCTSRDASASDKAQVLVIDFKGKTVGMRRGDQMRKMGVITEDKTTDGVRSFRMSENENGQGRAASMKLTKAGKLSIDFGGAGGSAEATCTAES